MPEFKKKERGTGSFVLSRLLVIGDASDCLCAWHNGVGMLLDTSAASTGAWALGAPLEPQPRPEAGPYIIALPGGAFKFSFTYDDEDDDAEVGS